MSKELLVRTLDRIKLLRPGEFCELTVESAGILRAFLDARGKSATIGDAERAFHEKISRVLSDWETGVYDPRTIGTDGRKQHMLRSAIDKIQQDRWHAVTEDDIRLLRGTKSTLERRQSAGNDEHDRLLALLTSSLGKYENRQSLAQRLSSTTIGRSLGMDEEVVELVLGASAAASGTVEVKNFVKAKDVFQGGSPIRRSIIEGITAGRAVRLFEFSGETELEGDIPADVHVNVLHGGITVRGMVSGCVTAFGTITIRGNVQGGLVVSKRGDIALEGAMVGSHIVAKAGAVSCTEVDAAQCVFGWKRVRVSGPVFSGRICGALINVDGNVGGVLQSCGPISAHKMLAVNRRSPSVACLCRQLTCEDYGQFMDKATEGRLQRVVQLEVNIEAAEHLNRFTLRLARNCYRTALFYLLGGAENASSAMDLQGLQIKSAHLRQVIAIAEGVARYYSGALADERVDMESLTSFRDENLKSLATVRKEVMVIPEEFGTIHIRYVMDRCEELKGLIENLNTESQYKRGRAFLNGVYFVRVSDWRGVLGDTDRKVDEIVARFGVDQAVIDRLESDPDSLPTMLDECIALQKRSPSIDDSKRAESPLIRLLKDSADRYFRSMKRGQEDIETARVEYRDLRSAFMIESTVLFGDLVPGRCEVMAAAYEPGTVITTSPDRLEGYDTNMAETIVLATAIEEPTTFRLMDTMVQRVSN